MSKNLKPALLISKLLVDLILVQVQVVPPEPQAKTPQCQGYWNLVRGLQTNRYGPCRIQVTRHMSLHTVNQLQWIIFNEVEALHINISKLID